MFFQRQWRLLLYAVRTDHTKVHFSYAPFQNALSTSSLLRMLIGPFKDLAIPNFLLALVYLYHFSGSFQTHE